MGVVYQAYDAVRCIEVALKTLRDPKPDAIYRLKNEFRALADVSHPNLITLHDLVCHDGQWFFTMDLVAGADFITYVREAGAYAKTMTSRELFAATLAAVPSTQEEIEPEPSTTPEVRSDRTQSVLNLRRLRPALRQLARGLHALHTSGRLHRDIKPSNIIVDDAGRVVILDFGLVAELRTDGRNHPTAKVRSPARPPTWRRNRRRKPS